jgi:hypothetical protein
MAWSRPGRASSAATGLVFDLSKRNTPLLSAQQADHYRREAMKK